MLKTLIIILLMQQSQSLNPSSVLYQEVFTYHNETAEKAEYASQVVDKIYNSFRQWFFTIIFCEFTYFENRILKYTETKDYGYPVILLNSCPSSDKRKVKPRIDTHGQTAYVVTSDELSFEVNDLVIEALIRTGVFRPRSSVIFIINVPVKIDSYFYYLMLVHFQLLWSRKVTNSVLIVWTDRLIMYAYNPFFNEVKDITNVTDVTYYLAHEYNNLHRKTLRLSVFRKIFLTNEEGPVKCNSRLAAAVMERLNATCEPLAPRDGNTVGDLLDNGTATGVTKDLIDGYTELELNSRILKNSYYGYIDTTYPLYQDELCFLTLKSGRQSSFTTAIKLISMKMLLIFMFNVIFLTTVGIIIRQLEAKLFGFRRRRPSSTLIDLVKCFLRQTFDVTFLGPAFRTVVFLIMMYALVINSVIDSIIITAITYPRYKPEINTMNELWESNLTFGIHNRHMDLFKQSITEDLFNSILHRVEILNDKRIKEVIDQREFQYAILLRKSDALSISRKPANIKDGRPIFHTVLECPIPCSIVYGFRYGSPYLPRINSILFHLHQGGILNFWSKSEEHTSSSDLGKILNNGDQNKERLALSTNNLQEVFYVWMIGLLISAITFGYEIFLRGYIKNLINIIVK